jgi:arylsulfatase A-like enzyme
VPFNAVHWPFQPPGSGPRSLAMWRDGERSEYAGMLTAMDAAIGHVMDTLKRKGLAENTLVIFTNDNGGERLSDNSPLFHHKATLFEGGIRVPAIARWPGKIAADKTTSQVCATMDFSATMLAAAGAKPPVALDGVDVLPVLTGKRAPFERELYWRINQPGRRQKAVRKGRWKYMADGDIELLFDVVEDPGERRNLFYRNQDAARGLREAHARWEQDVTM